jgi:protein phosphatase 1 regulatory subunit 7
MPASNPPTEPTDSPSPKQSPSAPLRASNGWDGKLRHPSKETSTSLTNPNRKAILTNPEALTDPDYSDPDAPPPDILPADEDLLDDWPPDSTEIDLLHMRISSIPSLRLSRFSAVEKLCLRQNAISSIEFLDGFGQKLQDLDLYDNLIKHVDGLEGFAGSLESLDLSFNKIKRIQGVGALKELRDLYFVQNRIQKIEGLEGLGKLTMLELAANRIRVSLSCVRASQVGQRWC